MTISSRICFRRPHQTNLPLKCRACTVSTVALSSLLELSQYGKVGWSSSALFWLISQWRDHLLPLPPRIFHSFVHGKGSCYFFGFFLSVVFFQESKSDTGTTNNNRKSVEAAATAATAAAAAAAAAAATTAATAKEKTTKNERKNEHKYQQRQEPRRP